MKELSPRLVSALDRAIALSRDTLAFGRMEASVLVKEQTNLYEMTNDVFDNAAAFGISFENDVIDGFMVHADKTHLYRAIFNLVKNSVDAMTPTDMRLPEGAEKEPDYGTVEINAKYDGKRALIYVSDNGPGIPQNTRETLFEPFRGSNKPGGSGLGIAIAAEIIRAHKGELSLHQSDETGTTFQIELLEAIKPNNEEDTPVYGSRHS